MMIELLSKQANKIVDLLQSIERLANVLLDKKVLILLCITTIAGMESSRTHFKILGHGLKAQVIGLGLEAYTSSKILCPRLRNSITF